MTSSDEQPTNHKSAPAVVTPGARIAAAKAAKAARKAADRGKQADATQHKVLHEAAEFRSWVDKNRRTLSIGIGAPLLAVAAFFGWSTYRASQNGAAAQILKEGIESASATVMSPDSPEMETRGEVYSSVTERATKSSEAFVRTEKKYSGSKVALWARVGEANSLFELGKYEEAQAAFADAVSKADDNGVVLWRALEGLALSAEAASKTAEAKKALERLKTVSSGDYRGVAEYHLARMMWTEGRKAEAKTALEALVKKLKAERTEGEVRLPYVLEQSEALLAEINPDATTK